VNFPPILITREEVQQLLDWEAVYGATREGILAEARASDLSELSGQVHYDDGSLHLKAASLEEKETLSVKANLRPAQGGMSGILLAYDLRTQRLAGLIDAGSVTARRTGAIGAVATKHLTAPGLLTVAILGTGPVGLETARALARVVDIKHMRLWSRTPASSLRAATDLEDTIHSESCSTVEEAVGGADVVVTATPTSSPILGVDQLAANALILALGADTAGKRELQFDVMANADIVADVPADALRVGESAYLPTARRREVSALSRLLQTSATPKRTHSFLVFDSVGSSFVDAAVTSVIMRRAVERGVGSPVHLRS
jgi:ornithine cyclodeaminase